MGFKKSTRSLCHPATDGCAAAESAATLTTPRSRRAKELPPARSRNYSKVQECAGPRAVYGSSGVSRCAYGQDGEGGRPCRRSTKGLLERRRKLTQNRAAVPRMDASPLCR